jgi:hypothetical protein
MKKNSILFSIFFLVSLLLTSCAFHYGNITSSASLSANNFRIVKLAKGEATATRVFGLGGLGKEALVAEAKADLLQNYPLKDGQVLANITVDFKNSFVFFINTTKATVTADIIEFK